MDGPCCEVCGEEHEELEPAFRMPDAVFAVPAEEREARVRSSDDFVSIDDRVFFIRCVAPIPVAGRDWPYSWGFWVKVARRHFEEYRRYFSEDPPADHPGFEGTIANQTRLLPPTLGLPVHVHLGRGTQRPQLMLLGASHPLTRQQEAGLSAAELHGWTERVIRAHSGDGWQEPPVPAFAATLEQHGWRIVPPRVAGRAAARLPAPPAAGDAVKAPFQFLAADARGEVDTRTELMWVRLDEVRRDGGWSGTLDNHPVVPGPLDCGTRVWLRPEEIVDHHSAGGAVRPAPVAPEGEAPRWAARLRRWLRRGG